MLTEIRHHARQISLAFAFGRLLAGKANKQPTADEINEFFETMCHQTPDEDISSDEALQAIVDMTLVLSATLAAARILWAFNPGNLQRDTLRLSYPEGATEDVPFGQFATMDTLFANFLPDYVSVTDDLSMVVLHVKHRPAFLK